MEEEVKIPTNVLNIIYNHSIIYGNFQSENFAISMDHIIRNNNIVSPIEQILFSAISLLRDMNYIDEIYNHTESNKTGLFICPQFMIDKYSVDFLLIYNNHVSNNKKMLIVECDSQQWHDRSEKERRYEKIRERYIVSKGYKIFHFTGKEITDNPFKVAIEILNYLTNNEIEEVDYYEEFTDKGSNNG